jgi:hypothetical protein
LLAEQDGPDDREDGNDRDILDDGWESVRGPIVAPGIDDERDDGVDDGQDQREPGNRPKKRGITEALAGRGSEDCEGEDERAGECEPSANVPA